MTGSLPASAAALLILLCAVWGFGQVTVKLGLAGISPLVLCGLRSLIAVPLLLAWCAWRGVPVWVRDGALRPGLLIGAFFTLEFVAIFESLRLTTAARCTLMVYTAPFWAVLGAHFLVPGDRLDARKLLGLILAFAGLAAAFGEHLGGPADGSAAGDLLALAGGLLWGATIVAIKATRLTRISAERTLLFQIGMALLLLPLGYALGEAGIFAPTPMVWAALAFQGVVIAFVSFIAWFWLVARHRASALAPFMFLAPVFSAVAGWIVLGEPVTGLLAVSLALIGAGIWVVNRA